MRDRTIGLRVDAARSTPIFAALALARADHHVALTRPSTASFVAVLTTPSLQNRRWHANESARLLLFLAVRRVRIIGLHKRVAANDHVVRCTRLVVDRSRIVVLLQHLDLSATSFALVVVERHSFSIDRFELARDSFAPINM